MTSIVNRQLVSHLAIAAALCGGLHLLVAQPLASRADGARAEIERYIISANDDSRVIADHPSLLRMRDKLEQEAAAFGDAGVLAREKEAMFSRMMELAEHAGVQIDQITPETVNARKPAEGEIVRPGDLEIHYSVSGSGDFAPVTEFLRLAGTACGFSRIRSGRLAPIYDPGGADVSFSVSLQVFSFDASPIVAAPVAEGGQP